jgi:hypothetical protein
MTEQEWLTSDDPRDLLDFLRDQGRNRKLRLYACEALREFIDTQVKGFPNRELFLPRFPNLREAPNVATQFADGLAGADDLQQAHQRSGDELRTIHKWLETASCTTCHPDAWQAATDVDKYIAYEAQERWIEEGQPAQEPGARLLGPQACELWRCDLVRDIFGNPFRPIIVDARWLAWNGGAMANLARSIYADRAFDRLPILADALEEAGCTDAEILAHCRGPGPHVRGCWVVDQILGKE